MPKIPRELSPLEVSRLKNEGAHAVGGVPGLYLQVLGGSRSWVLRFVVGGRRRRMGLGPFPSVTLAAAKEKARAAHQVIDRGEDPIQEGRRAVHRCSRGRVEELKASAAVGEHAGHLCRARVGVD